MSDIQVNILDKVSKINDRVSQLEKELGCIRTHCGNLDRELAMTRNPSDAEITKLRHDLAELAFKQQGYNADLARLHARSNGGDGSAQLSISLDKKIQQLKDDLQSKRPHKLAVKHLVFTNQEEQTLEIPAGYQNLFVSINGAKGFNKKFETEGIYYEFLENFGECVYNYPIFLYGEAATIKIKCGKNGDSTNLDGERTTVRIQMNNKLIEISASGGNGTNVSDDYLNSSPHEYSSGANVIYRLNDNNSSVRRGGTVRIEAQP